MDIVVRSPNWIGDCIMSLPALRALTSYCPSDDIYLVTKQYLADVFVNLPGLSGVITIPNNIGFSNITSTAATLKPYGFQQGILFTNSFSSAFLFRLAGIEHLTGYGKDMRSFLLAERLPFFQHSTKHHTHFYMDLIERFVKVQRGIDSRYRELELGSGFSPEIIITEEERTGLFELPIRPEINWHGPLIGIAPSAAYGTAKQWIPQRFTSVIKKMIEAYPSCTILLFGSTAEREKIETIISGIAAPFGQIHNLAGKLTLRQSVIAISLCSVFLANDSGLMHVAAGLNVPLVAIFGPTTPFNTAPRPTETGLISILHYPVHCAPCQYRDCPTNHACMKAVSIDEVFQSIQKLLNKPQSNPNPTE